MNWTVAILNSAGGDVTEFSPKVVIFSKDRGIAVVVKVALDVTMSAGVTTSNFVVTRSLGAGIGSEYSGKSSLGTAHIKVQ